jgi:hypothetical protein
MKIEKLNELIAKTEEKINKKIPLSRKNRTKLLNFRKKSPLKKHMKN